MSSSSQVRTYIYRPGHHPRRRRPAAVEPGLATVYAGPGAARLQLNPPTPSSCWRETTDPGPSFDAPCQPARMRGNCQLGNWDGGRVRVRPPRSSTGRRRGHCTQNKAGQDAPTPGIEGGRPAFLEGSRFESIPHEASCRFLASLSQQVTTVTVTLPPPAYQPVGSPLDSVWSRHRGHAHWSIESPALQAGLSRYHLGRRLRTCTWALATNGGG